MKALEFFYVLLLGFGLGLVFAIVFSSDFFKPEEQIKEQLVENIGE